MPELSLIQQIAVWVLPVLLAITLHEAAHGFVAWRLGDPTAKLLGRVSLNPVRHIDPVGTLFVPLLMGVITQFSFVFGWAKPVPFNPANLRNKKYGPALVAIAGPLSNLLMASLWAGLLKTATLLHPESSIPALFLLLTARAGILINLLLLFLNILPIPPLDGSRVLACVLPYKAARQFELLEPYGFLIVLLLAITGILGRIIGPMITLSLGFFRAVLGL